VSAEFFPLLKYLALTRRWAAARLSLATLLSLSDRIIPTADAASQPEARHSPMEPDRLTTLQEGVLEYGCVRAGVRCEPK
jgi:hypothetical protein